MSGKIVIAIGQKQKFGNLSKHLIQPIERKGGGFWENLRLDTRRAKGNSSLGSKFKNNKLGIGQNKKLENLMIKNGAQFQLESVSTVGKLGLRKKSADVSETRTRSGTWSQRLVLAPLTLLPIEMQGRDKWCALADKVRFGKGKTRKLSGHKRCE